MMTPMNGGIWAFATITAAGYCCAVLVATIVTILAQMLSTAVSGFGVWFYTGGVNILPAALVITFITALPGFLVTVWLQRRFRLASLTFFAAAAAADALLALRFVGVLTVDASDPKVVFTLCCVAGGIVGGLTYRLTSTRLAAAFGIAP